MSKKNLSFIVPAFNEGKNLAIVVKKILELAPRYCLKYEILIFDDASTDNTGEIADLLAERHKNIKVFHNRLNKGIGYSFWRGVREAKFEYSMMLFGDNDHPKMSIQKVVEKIGTADIIIPYYTNFRETKTWLRYHLSWIYTRIVNFLTGLSVRYYNGITVHKTGLVKNLSKPFEGFSSQAQLIVELLKNGASYNEVAIANQDVKAGASSALSYRSSFEVSKFFLWLIWRYRIRSLFNSSLSTSKAIGEASYFDEYARKIDVGRIDINRAFNLDSREGKFILSHIPNNLSGKLILDIGCGDGKTSVFFAKREAKVIGIDISPEMVKSAQQLAKLHRVSKLAKFKTSDAHRLDYRSNSFDIVNAEAVLHHVDLSKVLAEVHRVLKPGGILIFSDPLDYNPIIKFYDKFAASDLRSPNERRLNLRDIRRAESLFKRVEWIGTDISSLLLFALYFLYLKATGAKVPTYWHEHIQKGYTLCRAYSLCNTIDSFLPKSLHLLGWRVVAVCEK